MVLKIKKMNAHPGMDGRLLKGIDDMKINFNERVENGSNTEVKDNTLKENIKLSVSEEDYSNDLDEICSKVEKEHKDIKVSSEKEEDLFERKIKEAESIQEKDIEKQFGNYIYFVGKADVNSDYGEGGGNQYFIQNASLLKEKGNLVVVDREMCKFNPETDVYSPKIGEQNERQVHWDDRPLREEEVRKLDSSMPDEAGLETKKREMENYETNKGTVNKWNDKITNEELKYLEENTPDAEWLTRNPTGWKREDFFHPAGNQQDTGGKNYPDGWTNPLELKDGTIYYQLLPNLENGEESKTPYFTDKETVDSCRDKNGTIILSALMQKLQKEPNKEQCIDSDGNVYEAYVEEYSIIQYKFKEDVSKD